MKNAALSSGALCRSIDLVVAIITVQAPLADYTFVGCVDPVYVYRKFARHQRIDWSNITWAFTSGYAANWHPLTWISHMLDVQLFGSNAGRHHLTRIFIHSLSSVLLFALLRYTTNARWRSAFVAGLFAIHPIHVESVVWITERKGVLSTFFWILTMWAYVGYARQRSTVRYAAVLVLFACGLMSKPMVVTLPFVLLLFDLWPLGRLSVQSSVEKIPMLAITVPSNEITQ